MEIRFDRLLPAAVLGALILQVIFLILRLGGLVEWSWWWVLSPLWLAAIPFVVVELVGAALAIVVRFKRK